MADKQSSPLGGILLRAPGVLVILFLFYLLGRSFVRLVRGFSIPLGIPDLLTKSIIGSMLLFVLFICWRVIMQWLQARPTRPRG